MHNFMSKKLIILLLGQFFWQSTGIAQLHHRALFLGNSYTYVNDLPSMISSLALSAGDTLTHASNTPGGYTLQGHTSNVTSTDLIAAGTWDYVVLQEQSQMPSFPLDQVTTDVLPFAAMLNESIIAANPCAETVFYMTWGRKNGDAGNCPSWPPVCSYEGMDDLLRERYETMATDNEGILSPVGAVWRYIRANYPDLELYQADESHPSVMGTYAAACTFYSVIFRKSPLLISDDQGLNATDAALIRTAVETIVYQNFETWLIGSYDPVAALTYNIVSPLVVECSNLSEAESCLWSFGDGNYSSEFNPIHTYAILGSYTLTLIVNACNRSDTTSQTIVLTESGIDPSYFQSGYLYPNPAKKSLQLIGMEHEDMVIYNMSGEQMDLLHPSSVNYLLDVSNWPSGMYIIVRSNSNKGTLRFIVE
jgi:Secretion system C-terminal sorting domain/PKD domain